MYSPEHALRQRRRRHTRKSVVYPTHHGTIQMRCYIPHDHNNILSRYPHIMLRICICSLYNVVDKQDDILFIVCAGEVMPTKLLYCLHRAHNASTFHQVVTSIKHRDLSCSNHIGEGGSLFLALLASLVRSRIPMVEL